MKTVVLCGSMKFKSAFLEIAEYLEKRGFNVKLPIECMNNEPKIIASRAHIDRIIAPDTDYVLVINQDKPDKPNYIGPNSFAEIAFGFYYHKKVFLLNDIYEPYKDELLGWQVKPLQHNLNNLK